MAERRRTRGRPRGGANRGTLAILPVAAQMREQGFSDAAIRRDLRVATETIRKHLGPPAAHRPVHAAPATSRRSAPVANPTWETARYAFTCTVADWLDSHIAAERIASCDVGDLISTWRRRKGTTSFWTVDRVMTNLGLHVAQLPEAVWAEHRTSKAP